MNFVSRVCVAAPRATLPGSGPWLTCLQSLCSSHPIYTYTCFMVVLVKLAEQFCLLPRWSKTNGKHADIL